ncbi:hypothetical protein ACFVWR_04785 [Leifsonia sp. NPDC058292]|uniref:hypothetical protein n=1 Tax=Leifsonia sp. NPDC058292 TaxID=3346428 RepID=UPI0036DE7FAE
MKAIRTLVVVAAAALALAGCSGATGAASGSATPSVAASVAPTEETPAAVTSIVISGDGLHLYVGKTQREVVKYTESATAALAAVEDAVGPSTGSKDWPATNHTPPSTDHLFDGLTVREPHYKDAVAHDYLATPAWSVSTSAARVSDVPISTTAGLTVGSSIEEIRGEAEPNRLQTMTIDDVVSAYILVEASPGGVLIPDGASYATGVMVEAEPWPGPITLISAPTQLNGA